MSETMMLFGLLGVHAVLCVAVGVCMYRAPSRMNMAHMVWIVLLPVIGPVCGAVLVRSLSRGVMDTSWMDTAEERHRLRFGSIASVEETVPLEEALLINDPVRRRKMMMSILRSDPMSYLDLLLVARFNEDTETAHYAASTIMELQRQLQMALQERQAELLHDAKNIEKHRDYIELLQKYCESGLLEGQLLRRHRLMLAEALEEAGRVEEDITLMAMAVQNYLALEDGAEAKRNADRMLQLWPYDEASWLEAMRVTVETRNQQELRRLMESMRHSPIDWSKGGREQMTLWMEDDA